jgi:hypothetical protein
MRGINRTRRFRVRTRGGASARKGRTPSVGAAASKRAQRCPEDHLAAYGRGRTSSRSGSPPWMNRRASSVETEAIRRSASSPALGWRPSSAPTRTAKTRSYGCSPASRVRSSAATWRTLMRPDEMRGAAEAVARATADADRSIARMCPVVSRAATARAAAPVPQPISRTRDSGRRGRASTIAARRGDKAGGMHQRYGVGDRPRNERRAPLWTEKRWSPSRPEPRSAGSSGGDFDIRYRSCSRRCTWKAEPHTSAIWPASTR